MSNPIYEIPVSGPDDVPFAAPPLGPPLGTSSSYPGPLDETLPAASNFRSQAAGFPPSSTFAPPARTFRLQPAWAPPPAYSAPPAHVAAPAAPAPTPPTAQGPGFLAETASVRAPAFVPAPEPVRVQRVPESIRHVPDRPFDSANPEPEGQSPIAHAEPDLISMLQGVLFAVGSDLHVSGGAIPMIRIDGSLQAIEGAPIWSKNKVRNSLFSLLTPAQRAKFDEKLELDFAYTLSSNARFRVNFYQQRGAVGGAFRLIPSDIRPLHELGVPEVVARFATLARGLVLVAGPTGSGKSTTLAALIDLVNRTRADHIVTVEDPIEFLHSNRKSLVNQREVGADTHSFAAALKHVLRQDPDVILIGELRDLETISVALTAAETGHLVFATLHTQDAPQTIDRIIDVFPSHQQGQVRAQLAATLQGVVCQTLVKRANGKGRAVATEVLVTTPAVANLIREGKTYQVASAMQAGRDLGMHTMDQHLAEMVNHGQITHEAALEKVHDLEGFKRLVHRAPGASKDFEFSSPHAAGENTGEANR